MSRAKLHSSLCNGSIEIIADAGRRCGNPGCDGTIDECCERVKISLSHTYFGGSGKKNCMVVNFTRSIGQNLAEYLVALARACRLVTALYDIWHSPYI